jgi:hypothetical protein
MSESTKPTLNEAENGNKSKPLLCEVFDFFGLQFNVTQYRWGRKLYGGIWYRINPKGLIMSTFWSRNEIKSCQSETICFEVW